MKKARLLCLIIILGLSINLQLKGQVSVEAQNWMPKYWLYRWRLVNDFIKIGDLQGESIPFAERNSYNNTDLKIGDGTQKLGMYICVLATEYALLYENSRWTDLEKTKTELYYALEAIERLDCTTENYPPYDVLPAPYGENSPYNCNGYLGRDDIPVGFLDEPAKAWDPTDTRTNRDVINQDYTKFCYPHGLGDVTDLHDYPLTSQFASLNGSDFITLQLDPGNRANEPNKDQYLCLWQGLGLVSKYVHDYNYTVTLNDGSTVQYNFYIKARELYVRLLEYMKYYTGGIPTIPFSTIDWLTTTPFGQTTAYGGDVSAGVALPFSFPIAQAGNKVIFNENGFYNQLPYTGVPVGFHDWQTILTNNLFWRYTSIDFSNQTIGGTVNQSMYCQLAAMSDSWRVGGFPFSLINTTPYSIYDHAVDYDWEAYYTTLWSVWNNRPIPANQNLRNKVINAVRDDLNNAPCEGPFNVTLNSTGIRHYSYQWASNFKYFRNVDESHWGVTVLPEGYYNGLDYLLMHNLFYLMYNGGLPFYQDLVDRVIDYPVPGVPANVNVPQPLVLNAFHSITANNTVEANYDIDFHAGYEMTFKPGFHIEAGADFHAYIEPFTCVNGEYRNVEDSTIATAYGFNERFNFTNHGIIDYSGDEQVSQEMQEELVEDVSHQMMIFPNPSEGLFTYITNENTGDMMHQVEVYNMIGDLVFSEKIKYNGQHSVNLGDVTSGIYIVKVISGEIVFSSKLMVE